MSILSNSGFDKYVISVCDQRYFEFKQYTESLDFGHIHKLPTKTTNKHWIGTGLSHQDCVRHAMCNNSKFAMVFEDDCRLTTEYGPVLSAVINYMNNNDNWEYINLSHTFLYNWNKTNRMPNIEQAENLASENRFSRINDMLIEIDCGGLKGPVIGNSCCVIYNSTVYEKYLNDFDPYQHEWCDVWSPKNLKTLLVCPVLAYQEDKPWMKTHHKAWSCFLEANID